ncbi:hypothetical protein GTZ99_03575 [Novosphingobium sp. FSY-8]|uniref:Type IV secretion system protein VirB6 n=1 Tax=Novosphingobium ovatum TaxID=1908523 RepID=A0ABW9XAV0_9SPHN|nr:type IV secretion system protein [Novosphingobium ovatum]NBC35632.1 hypothetical protein [Novosphingobium ovatum]
MGCAGYAAGAGGQMVAPMVDYADCRVADIAAQGWQALGIGALGGAWATGLFTLAVAALGYRWLLGHGGGARMALGLVARIGVVLALCGQWSAWQAVVANAALRGPQDLAARMLAPAGVAAGGLPGRVDGVVTALEAWSRYAVEGERRAAPANPRVALTPDKPPQITNADRAGLAQAARVVAVAALVALVGLHVGLGGMLAVGPICVALAVFDGVLDGALRWVWLGWARGLVGVMLGAAVVPLVLALMLSVVEPQLATLRAGYEGGAAVAPFVMPLVVSAWVLAWTLALCAGVLVWAMGRGGGWVARGEQRENLWSGHDQPAAPPVMPAAALPMPGAGEWPRARGLADRVAALTRPEAAAHMAAPRGLWPRARAAVADAAPSLSPLPSPLPGGRRTDGRHGGMARRRSGGIRR